MFGKLFRRIYVRPPEPIPREHRRLLLLVGAAMLIAGYDVNIYGLAIPQIQKTFDIAEAAVYLATLGRHTVVHQIVIDRLGADW